MFSLSAMAHMPSESYKEKQHISILPTANEEGWESGCRLSLQILLRVFKADTSLKKGLIHRSVYIKSSCDLHLLAAANRSIQLSPLLAALKVIISNN